jgi:uncharacterized protein (TIGR00369 family)
MDASSTDSKPDLLQWVSSVNAATGFIHAAGVETLSAERGWVVMRMNKQASLLQFSGAFHGGAIAGLADQAAGAAASTAFEAGKIAVTVDLHVNYLHPAQGEYLIATAKTASTGTSLAVVTVDVSVASDSDGEPKRCAMATVTLRAVALKHAL